VVFVRHSIQETLDIFSFTDPIPNQPAGGAIDFLILTFLLNFQRLTFLYSLPCSQIAVFLWNQKCWNILFSRSFFCPSPFNINFPPPKAPQPKSSDRTQDQKTDPKRRPQRATAIKSDDLILTDRLAQIIYFNQCVSNKT